MRRRVGSRSTTRSTRARPKRPPLGRSDDASKTAKDPGDGSKLVAVGKSGWEAYALGGNLFLKRFADQPTTAQATGEGEICIYPGATWIEFEVQGPYKPITAGGSLPWKVEWRLVKIPS